MNRLMTFLFMCVFFDAAVHAQPDTRGLKARLQSQAGKRWAICIGVNNYDDLDIVKLKKAANDAWLLSGVLETQGDFKVYTFTDVEKDGALRAFTNNFFPTKIKIEQFLDNIGQYIKPDDLVVFSFSGHGVNDANANGYLLPLDCRLSNLYATAVSEATITAWLKRLGVTRSLVLLDACRSELRSGRYPGRDILYSPKFESAKVSAVFYSSEKGAVSYEDPTSPNGAFTRFVAAGLQGAGDRDNDGLITFRELQAHVEDAMMDWALGTGHSQRPYIRLLDEQSGDLALAIVDWAGIKMVSIPGGTFQMGSNNGQDDEKPVHTVTISPFEMSATEITVGQFRAFVNETGYRTEAEHGDGALVLVNGKREKKQDANWKNPYMEQGNDYPVICVSWNDAKAFCDWLKSKTGGEVRLPTEAEWEYACRAGTTTEYYTGDSENDLVRVGWYYGNSGDQSLVAAKWDAATISADRCRTHPVGQKTPNTWGLYDMHGNVLEWCADWYGNYGSGSETEPTGAQTGIGRVLRGGSWDLNAYSCRSADRSTCLSDYGFDSFGFRVVRRP